jgi:hypothetical protein
MRTRHECDTSIRPGGAGTNWTRRTGRPWALPAGEQSSGMALEAALSHRDAAPAAARQRLARSAAEARAEALLVGAAAGDAGRLALVTDPYRGFAAARPLGWFCWRPFEEAAGRGDTVSAAVSFEPVFGLSPGQVPGMVWEVLAAMAADGDLEYADLERLAGRVSELMAVFQRRAGLDVLARRGGLLGRVAGALSASSVAAHSPPEPRFSSWESAR